MDPTRPRARSTGVAVGRGGRAAAVAREIEGSDEAQILMRLPGTGKKPKPAKKRKRSKGFSRKR